MAEGGGILWHTSLPRLGNRQLPGNNCTQHCLPDSELSVQIEPVYLDYLRSPITDWSLGAVAGITLGSSKLGNEQSTWYPRP